MKLFGVGILLFLVGLPAYGSDPDFARHLNRIETLLSNDDVDTAAGLAKALVADNEEQKALHQRLLGYIYLHEGDYDRAYVAYTNALEYRKLPESLRKDVRGALVSLSMKRGRPEMAIQHGKAYLEKFPPFQPIENLYTRALFSEQRYGDALTQANAIIARYADVPEFIWQIKLLSEEQLQQHRALINTTRVIQDKFGHDVRWQRKRAASYAALGEARAALKTLQDEAKAGAELTEADYLNMSQYASMFGDIDQAKRLLNQGINSEAVTVNREVLKRKLQYHMQAMEWMDAWEVVSVLNKEPELSLVKVQVRIASQLKRWQEAANLAQQAIDMGGSRDDFLWEILGYSAMKTNQFERARSAYERLKVLDPNGDADVWLKTLELMGKE
ncbi:tetratricopeptide repeat protein [Grimontia marina]|nr:tetratricopeptide repeat protein [Grimontia marina]